jgi:DNA-binding winged helix-turn-helix (wHTH) protein
MKRSFIKDCIILVSLITIGIVIILFIKKTGKENIRPIVEETLSQAIDIDYYRRANKTYQHSKGKGLGRKMKGLKIDMGNGPETIEFEDSIEEERGIQLVNQYMFTKINPLQPHDFNEVFQQELKKRGVNGKTGVIYYHEDIAHSSEENLEIIASAIQSNKTFIDIKETAAVKAWVDCDVFTCLRHGSPVALGALTLNAVLLILSVVFMARRSSRSPYQVMEQPIHIIIPANGNSTDESASHHAEESPLLTFTEKGIRIDKNHKQAYIDGRLLQTTPMTFSIFQLLAENMEVPITRQQLEQELWENPEKETDSAIGNRLHQNISKLRKALKDFPQYGIEGGKGKGYKLTLTPTANGTEET